MVPWCTQTKTKMTINMIKKMTQYLLQRRCALSLLLIKHVRGRKYGINVFQLYQLGNT